MNHKQRLIDYLKTHKKITTKEAIDQLGNTRLSEYIRQLRKEGYEITNIHCKGLNRFGEITRYDEFELTKDLDNLVLENENHISM